MVLNNHIKLHKKTNKMKQKNKLPKQKSRSVYSFGQVIKNSAASTTDTDPTSPVTLTTTQPNP